MRSLLASLLRRYSAAHANHRRIAAGAAWTAGFVLAAKLIAAAREVVIAWKYGVSGVVDAYQLAFTVATWLPQLLTAVATIVVVPRLVAIVREPATYRAFTAELNGRAVVSGTLMAAATCVMAVPLIEALSERLGAETAATAVRMVLTLAPVALFATVSGVLAARLQARQRYGYSFLEAMPAMGVVAFVAVWPGANPAALVWGTVCGFVLQAALLALMVQQYDRPIGQVHLRERSGQWSALYGPLIFYGAGQMIVTATIPIDQAFASSLGEGAIASLGYANRILGLLTGLAQVVLARALLPVLAGVAADGQFETGRDQTIRWSWLMLGLGTVIAASGWLIAPLAVRLVFERGAFTPADTPLVAELLRYGLLQLTPFFAGIVLVQWCAVTGRHRALLLASIPAVLIKIVLNALLAPLLGVAGIMVASSVMYVVIFVVLLTAIRGAHWTPPMTPNPGRR